jgi:hypothetical protein
MNKNFVSIFFENTKVLIAQLNSTKKKILKYASYEIPAGTIENYKVVNQKALTEIFKKVWRELNITERSVGIIVPEFTTYSKSLTLPELEVKELDEAIRWQAQEYLPSSKEEQVLDWKITKKTDKGFEILAVSIPLDILVSFVDSVDAAGLLPLVVETPSLSLVRVSGNDDIGKIIVYIHGGLVVISISQGENILSSSVLDEVDTNLIVDTCGQMIKHYSNVKVQKIFLGGVPLDENVKKAVSSILNTPVEILKVNVAGLNENQIQDYLIPLSNQFKNPKEPQYEYTVNLLPPKWIKKYEDKRLTIQTWTLALISSIIIWSCFFSAALVFAMLTAQSISQQKSLHSIIEKQIPPDAASSIQHINLTSSKVITILRASDYPQKIKGLIDKIKPAGVIISDYHFDLDNGKITLIGKSATREALIEFKKNLENDPNFSRVDIPVSSLETQKDIEFNVNFNFTLE